MIFFEKEIHISFSAFESAKASCALSKTTFVCSAKVASLWSFNLNFFDLFFFEYQMNTHCGKLGELNLEILKSIF
jgi:hypothetical protein